MVMSAGDFSGFTVPDAMRSGLHPGPPDLACAPDNLNSAPLSQYKPTGISAWARTRPISFARLTQRDKVGARAATEGETHVPRLCRPLCQTWLRDHGRGRAGIFVVESNQRQ